MWSNNDSSETDRRRRTRQERREERNDHGATKQLGMWMVFFLGAAAIGNIFGIKRRLLNIERQSVRGHSSQSRGEYSSSGQSNRSYQSTSGSQEDRSAQEAQRLWRARLDEQQRTERIRRVKEAFAKEKVSQANAYNAWQQRRGDKWDWKWEGVGGSGKGRSKGKGHKRSRNGNARKRRNT